MRRSLRRQLHWLRVYAVVNTLVLVVTVAAAFRQAPAAPAELTVTRLNVVDNDGTLRMVIAGKDKMHPGVMDGKTIDRPRPVAGMIFFNDQGDEVGGLTYSGQEVNGTRRASASMMFDQLKQDQTIGFSYTESNGQRTAGFQVWDRPETHLSELIEKLNAANKIQDATARAAELNKIRAAAEPGPRRVFVGKTGNRAATVTLADAQGKPRLTLTVDPSGNPRIEFLDQDGKVVSRIPEK